MTSSLSFWAFALVTRLLLPCSLSSDSSRIPFSSEVGVDARLFPVFCWGNRQRKVKETTCYDPQRLRKHLVQFVKWWQFLFWSWILKECIEVQEKKKRVAVLGRHPQKREIRYFHVVVVQWRQRNVLKAWCMCRVFVLQNLNLERNPRCYKGK